MSDVSQFGQFRGRDHECRDAHSLSFFLRSHIHFETQPDAFIRIRTTRQHRSTDKPTFLSAETWRHDAGPLVLEQHFRHTVRVYPFTHVIHETSVAPVAGDRPTFAVESNSGLVRTHPPTTHDTTHDTQGDRHPDSPAHVLGPHGRQGDGEGRCQAGAGGSGEASRTPACSGKERAQG